MNQTERDLILADATILKTLKKCIKNVLSKNQLMDQKEINWMEINLSDNFRKYGIYLARGVELICCIEHYYGSIKLSINLGDTFEPFETVDDLYAHLKKSLKHYKSLKVESGSTVIAVKNWQNAFLKITAVKTEKINVMKDIYS